MREILVEIRAGRFAAEWVDEHRAGRPQYEARLAADLDHPIEHVGAALRARMSWLPRDSAGKARLAPFITQPGLAK
jgi:ketol-acid reductoisomerase